MVVFAERNLNCESEFGLVPYGECIAWFKKAIAAGNPYAYVPLAHAYEDGRGVAKNRRIAHLLFERSAAADCIGGRIGLAMDYASGDNVRENQMRAREEMLPAFRHLQSVRSDLTGSDLAAIASWYLQNDDERSSSKVFELSEEIVAIKGNCATKNLNYPDYASYIVALAIVLDVATHVDVSEEKKKNAVKMLQDICSHPHHSTSANASWALGLCYQLGIGVEVDLERALESFQIASDQGCEEATSWLASIYLQDGAKKNVSRARVLLEEVASHGNLMAQTLLGTQYANGAFGNEDYGKAKEWWLKAAEGGEAFACCNIGQCFRDGLGGTNIDYKEAAQALRRGNRGFSDGEIGLRFRVARSWFRKALDHSDGNVKVDCAALRGLARLARYEKEDAEASRLYCSAVEKGDADARSELIDWLGPNALSSASVADGLCVPEVRLEAEPVIDAGRGFSREEEAFLHKALRFLKRGGGELDVADEEKLETLAKELGIDAVRFEDLIKRAEDEHKASKEQNCKA